MNFCFILYSLIVVIFSLFFYNFPKVFIYVNTFFIYLNSDSNKSFILQLSAFAISSILSNVGLVLLFS
nr:MAG TPA: hypothetical protein [Caudoviricetes sp.]